MGDQQKDLPSQKPQMPPPQSATDDKKDIKDKQSLEQTKSGSKKQESDKGKGGCCG